jgi:thymidylate synthase
MMQTGFISRYERPATMEFVKDSLDDCMLAALPWLLEQGKEHTASRGAVIEARNVSITLRKPRARLSISEKRGKVFSALGELLWYLKGDNSLEFIQPYIGKYVEEAHEGTIIGAYGPRMFSSTPEAVNQFEAVADLLATKPNSRQAVVVLSRPRDVVERIKSIPCTVALHFQLRDGKLHLTSMLRSSDIYLGMPHDVFCFTMIQEIMSRRLGVELGEYTHFSSNLHFYRDRMPDINSYLAEGHQYIEEMPEMPPGDQACFIRKLCSLETGMRSNDILNFPFSTINDYWDDLLRLLYIFWLGKHFKSASENRQSQYIRMGERVGEALNSTFYSRYIVERIQMWTAQS